MTAGALAVFMIFDAVDSYVTNTISITCCLMAMNGHYV